MTPKITIGFGGKMMMLKKERKTRNDKRKRLTVRMDNYVHEGCRVLAFNSQQSLNTVINALLTAALASDQTIQEFYLAYGRKTGNHVMFWDTINESE